MLDCAVTHLEICFIVYRKGDFCFGMFCYSEFVVFVIIVCYAPKEVSCIFLTLCQITKEILDQILSSLIHRIVLLMLYGGVIPVEFVPLNLITGPQTSILTASPNLFNHLIE